MKEEEADWQIYHLIPESSATTGKELCKKSGLDAAAVAASLERLERSCLIECSGDSVRMLNFGEALLRNQFKYEKNLPFTIENGIIKERKN
ncbi:MarR family transcriptional regulator [uncultured Methanoregula sp.]|uniref:MarR family transcriptional regulator n=1 Tax=uncultured Methanoregula sp. TaxID=1005933 RepID=UPI002AAB212C|nr:MarR family transcriptional regulator [uncultured Methanoregula sp.]